VLEERPSLLAIVRSLRAGVADYIRMPCHFPEILEQFPITPAHIQWL
jgi:DNA-binding response OmpR family regulator